MKFYRQNVIGYVCYIWYIWLGRVLWGYFGVDSFEIDSDFKEASINLMSF